MLEEYENMAFSPAEIIQIIRVIEDYMNFDMKGVKEIKILEDIIFSIIICIIYI